MHKQRQPTVMLSNHPGARPGRRHHRDPYRGPRPIPFGFREFLGHGPGRRAMRRGEIRPLVLTTLTRRPMHGYEVIQELEAQSGGRWRPSAGSVYPTLQQLADEGLVTSEEIDGRRVYTLTDAGRAAAAEAPAGPRWGDRGPAGEGDLRGLAVQLIGAAAQVERVGSPSARQEAGRILAEARRQVYRLLADDEAPDTGPDEATDAPGPDRRPA
jgi:DNA-binding PadR family transcriptional regulator